MSTTGRDSYLFRKAGAREIALVSAMRVAIMQELRGEVEPSLDEVSPAWRVPS